MKQEISSLELHYLIQELQGVNGGKIEQIYQVGSTELLLHLHVSGVGKRFVRIVVGKLMYLTENKGDMPEKPPGFCLFLRRRLKNARISGVSQVGFERVVQIDFTTKDENYTLFIELFGKGNLILCQAGKVLSALEEQEWKDRSVKAGKMYVPPKKDIDISSIDLERFKSALNTSDKEFLVKALAIDFSFGGVYSEELCIAANVTKSILPKNVSAIEAKRLFDAVKRIFNRPLAPCNVFEGDSLVDIVPIDLDFYSNMKKEPCASFNACLDSHFSQGLVQKKEDVIQKKAKSKIDKVKEMIEKQEIRLKGLEDSEKENQRKGELIYENYETVSRLLAEIVELRKTRSLKELKKMISGKGIVKDINEKTGEVTLEI